MDNEAAGWLLIALGFLSGAALGLGFAKPGFLGGYASWERRMLRLGHIALVALGVLNIFWVHSAPRIAWPTPWAEIGGWLLFIGSVAMPLACVLCAYRRRAIAVFSVPVVALTSAATIAWTGMVLA